MTRIEKKVAAIKAQISTVRESIPTATDAARASAIEAFLETLDEGRTWANTLTVMPKRKDRRAGKDLLAFIAEQEAAVESEQS